MLQTVVERHDVEPLAQPTQDLVETPGIRLLRKQWIGPRQHAVKDEDAQPAAPTGGREHPDCGAECHLGAPPRAALLGSRSTGTVAPNAPLVSVFQRPSSSQRLQTTRITMTL